MISFLALAGTVLFGASAAMAAPGADVRPVPVIVVVKVPTPAGVTPERLRAGFEQAVPTFKAAPGLMRKSFTIGDDRNFGGVYFWQSRAAAEGFYSDAWRARILQTYGAPAVVEYFEAPLSITGQAVNAVTER